MAQASSFGGLLNGVIVGKCGEIDFVGKDGVRGGHDRRVRISPADGQLLASIYRGRRGGGEEVDDLWHLAQNTKRPNFVKAMAGMKNNCRVGDNGTCRGDHVGGAVSREVNQYLLDIKVDELSITN